MLAENPPGQSLSAVDPTSSVLPYLFLLALLHLGWFLGIFEPSEYSSDRYGSWFLSDYVSKAHHQCAQARRE
jgi:hypothetical protein